MSLIKSLLYRRNLSIFEEDFCFHLHLLQIMTFLYSLYRLFSREYYLYGLLDNSLYVFPRAYNNNMFFPVSSLSTLTFIYNFIPTPNMIFWKWWQYVSIFFSVMGLLGILPRLSALFTLVFFIHVTGIINATNAELEGGTVLMVGLVTLVITSKDTLYSPRKRLFSSDLNSHYRWPIFFFLLLISCFYTFAGLNKIFDVGLHWPFVLNLENLATSCLQNSTLHTSRYSVPEVCELMKNPLLSDISGIITLIGELFFISILWYPRLSFFFVASMISLHTVVYLTAGINFQGSSIMLICCLNWNDIIAWIRRKLSKKELYEN